MVINYCFTVYNEPELLRHTILRLQHPNARFFIHVDNRVDIQKFIDITKGIDNITFIKNRIASQWGDISTVDAILSLLRAALADGKDGYCIILSGQDYPLKTPEQIFQYLNSSYPKEFIHASTESQWRPWLKKIMMSHAKGYWITLGGKIKLVVYPRKHLKISGIPSLRFKQIPEIMRKLLSIDTLTTIKKYYFKRRQMPSGIKMYASETWFQITTLAAKYTLDYLSDNPDAYEYYRYFGLPEESMIQSIILSNPEFHKNWAGDYLSLISRTSTDKYDKLHLLPTSFDLLSKSIPNKHLLFARKVFWKNQEVIAFIDNLVDGK